MSAMTARREFLRGRSAKPEPLRPPWTLPESAFTDACTRCGDCERACPQRILVRGDGGFPEVDFRRSECTFCGRCAEACTANAFVARVHPPWLALATIAPDCLAKHGVVCQTCGDACQARALSFRHQSAYRVPVPVIDADVCSGCGACVASCPVSAISVAQATV
jgi:ferredoxin-type protein NapF